MAPYAAERENSDRNPNVTPDVHDEYNHATDM